MRTRKTVFLTALACFTLFTLFSYCSKDGVEQTLINDLTGTTWVTRTGIGNDDGIITIYAHFTTSNSGNYSSSLGEGKTKDGYGDASFTYSLNGNHGKINSSLRFDYGLGCYIPNEATIVVVDENTIGIGGRVFTKQ